jgi:hypothetical protein
MSRLIVLLTAILLFCCSAFAQTPNFDYPYMLTDANGYLVEDNIYDAPEFGDWDDDGDLDLMVGVFYDGNIWYYENVAGPGVEPVYETYTELTANGLPISVTYG